LTENPPKIPKLFLSFHSCNWSWGKSVDLK
jgi:hypothetical protein